MPSLNLLPITALTFSGTVLMRDDGLFLWLKRGFEIPTVRGEDQVVPRLGGRIARNRVADLITIELEGLVRGIEQAGVVTEPEAYYELVDEMVALFDPTAAPATLSYLHPDTSTRSILARTKPPLLWEELIPGRLARLNVELESVAGAWSST